jgi:hypothetical protein
MADPDPERRCQSQIPVNLHLASGFPYPCMLNLAFEAYEFLSSKDEPLVAGIWKIY